MENSTEPRVREGKQDNGWYIVRGSAGCYEFLHQDGVWRNSTYHDGYSGYYQTKQLAETALQNDVK